MVVKEIIELNGIQYAYHYSNKGLYIERNNVLYLEAIDPLDSKREYKETTQTIERDILLYISH